MSGVLGQYGAAFFLVCGLMSPLIGFSEAVEDKKGSITFSGRVIFEADYAQDIYNKDEGASSDLFIRQARIGVKSKIHKNLKGKLSADIAEGGLDLKDAYVRFWTPLGVSLQLGQFTEPFGLENLTSSAVIPALERSAPSKTFSPSRNLGAMLGFYSLQSTLQVGFFENESIDDSTSTYAMTGRVTTAFPEFLGSQGLLHLGLSGSYRDFNANSEAFDIEVKGELDISNDLIQIKDIEAESSVLMGVEMAYQYRSFLIQSEFFSQSVQALATDDGDSDVDNSLEPSANGFYVQLSQYFQKKSRSYKEGVFGKVPVKRKKGTFEVLARYSSVSLTDQEVENSVSQVAFGINYYASKASRFMLQGVYAFKDNEEDVNSSDGYGAGMRFQYLF